MRAIVDILIRDVRARLRDRSAILLGIVAPIVLIAVLSQLAGGTEPREQDLGYVAVDGGSSRAANALQSFVIPALRAQGVARVTDFPDVAAAREALDDGDVEAVLVSGGRAGSPGSIEVLHAPGSLVGGAIADAVAGATASRIDAATLLIAGLDRLAPGLDIVLPDQLLLREPVTVRVADSSGPGGLSTSAQVAVGMATFFLFFTVQFGLLGLLQERREGTLARLLAAVTPRQVLTAKLLVSFVLGVVSMVVLFVVARLMLDARLGDPFGVGVLIVCGVAAATSTVALVVGVSRTPEQAGLAQSMVALVLGILGGSFFSMARAGGFGAVATRFTPHYWFNEGLVRLSGGDGLSAVVVPAIALLGFAVLIGVPGVLLARRSVRP